MSLQLSENKKEVKKKVVVDTSILISATLTDGAHRKLIRKLIASDFESCIPQEVIDEFNEIISLGKLGKFKKYQPLYTEIFDELRRSSILLPYPSDNKYALEHSKEDEGIVNCCTENGIDYLVTIDKKTVGQYNGLFVIFAQDFYSSFLTN